MEQHGHKLVLNIRGSRWIENSANLTNFQPIGIQFKCEGIDMEKENPIDYTKCLISIQ